MQLPASRVVRVLALTGFFGVVPFVGTALAGSFTLTTAQSPLGVGFNQGFYTSAGAHTVTSSLTTTNTTQRSFFIFDLSLIGDEIIDSATLRVYNPSLTAGTQVGFFDMVTPAANVKLTASNASYYADLGQGIQYGGGAAVTVGYIPYDLLAVAIAAMNAQDGYFGIGAKLTSQAGSAFGTNTAQAVAAELVLQTHAAAVPDSGATLALFGLAGAALAVLRRRL